MRVLSSQGLWTFRELCSECGVRVWQAVAERVRPKLRELSEMRTHVSHLTAPSEAATAAIGRCVTRFVYLMLD
jgi:hypothetical protein